MKIFTAILLLCLGYLHFIDSKNTTKKTVYTSCEATKSFFRGIGYTGNDIYDTQQNEKLNLCSASPTCCNDRAEAHLFRMSESRRKHYTTPQTRRGKEIFSDNTAKFKDIFRELLRKSKARLDTMFRDTYKSRYVDNIHVFNDLYIAFNQYVNGSELLVKEKVDTFFAEVHKLVYMMTKPLTTFTKEYKNCIFDSTNFVQPFGDMQRKIGYQTSRPFLASRVFLQGLKTGMEVMTEILKMPAHEECSKAFFRMTQCSICRGVSDTRPCLSYCTNVMKGCFTSKVMIQPKWSEYISSMIDLAGKLEGPFNLEAAIEPLGVKISDAIMTFQENQSNVTVKVEEKCGKPISSINNLRRRRRSPEEEKASDDSNSGGDDYKTWVKKISESKDIFKKFKQETQFFINNGYKADSTLTHMYSKRKNASAFETLLADTKTGLEQMRHYWIELSGELCKNGIAAGGDTKCWNGANTSGYSLPVVSDDVHDLYGENPEMQLNSDEASKDILNHVKTLSRMIKKIKQALTGEERPDQEESSGQGSGFGSGEENAGSGEVIIPPDEEGSASGSGYLPVYTTTTTTTTTKDKCANSVDKNCLSTTSSTQSPNDVQILPNIEGEKKPSTGGRDSSSQNIFANVLLLWITSLIAICLL